MRDLRSAGGPAPGIEFDLAIPHDERRLLALAWLALGLIALLVSGLFSILLVLSRTPQLQTLFPVADFFRVALVVHVDLSVLVWFLAFGGAIWSLNGTPRHQPLAWLALALSMAGTMAMSLSPFVERGVPVMANYVPVLDGPVFTSGLIMFGAGIATLCLRSMLAVVPVGARISGEGALRFGLSAAMVSSAVAALAFAWSWLGVPRELDPRIYYELVFWGGGHVLQFTYTLLMLVCWIWLASILGARLPLSPRIVTLLFAIALLSVFLTPITYLAYDVTSVEHHRAQTLLMRFGGGLVIGPIALAVLWGLRQVRPLTPDQRPLRASLIASLVLFSAGGVIGFLISGSNVRIPAHYHGCIVGVTLAMMGIVYHLLPRLGFRAPQSRAAAWQPGVYGVGQLMHIVGLVWSGGYGVQRKVGGADQVLRSTGETLGMGLMGLGGLIAIIGGVMFVVIVLRALRRQEQDQSMRSAKITKATIPGPFRTLHGIGTLGSALALLILCASVLLRLTTESDKLGHSTSGLPASVEAIVRLSHRLAASGVGLLAIAAALLCWLRRKAATAAILPTTGIVVSTVLLAVIGPLTPGYRYAAVTVANVVGGVILLMCCWWLRESLAAAPNPRRNRDPLLASALVTVVLHIGSGAAASALAMRGVGWVAFLHMGSAVLLIIFVGAILWVRHGRNPLTHLVRSLSVLLATQLLLGLMLANLEARPVWLGLLHAMLSPVLAAGLVSIAVRDTDNESSPNRG